MMKSTSIQNRRTPRWLFNELNEQFGPFVLDAYADKSNALCRNFYTAEEDGSTRQWANVTFANPEFRMMQSVLEHAVAQAARDVRSVVIGPAGGSQGWYQHLAIRGTILLPDCRINFDDAEGRPTGPGCRENGANRDTTIMAFGGAWRNLAWKLGTFRVYRIELKHLRPAKG